MPNIPTTEETLRALDVLRSFVEGIDQTFGSIRSVGIATSTEIALPMTVVGGEPPSWALRVLAILTDDGGYMSPKDIIVEYRRRGWKEIKETDTRIYSTLAHLKVADKVDHNVEGRTYKIKT